MVDDDKYGLSAVPCHTSSAREAFLEEENANLRRQLATAIYDRDVAYLRHRPTCATRGFGAATTDVTGSDDAEIVRRIIEAFELSEGTILHDDGSLWFAEIASIRRAEYETMTKGDATDVALMLRDPQRNNLLYGFDNLAATLAQPSPEWPAIQASLCYDGLLTLAEAIAAVRLENPEAPIRKEAPEVETLLAILDRSLGFRVEFPNPFLGEVGLVTSRGVASYRSCQSLYQAWRINQLAPNGKILEIGGGLGRTAFYAWQMGLRDFTIVDLPLTAVAPAYFLSRVGLPVILHGELSLEGVRIVPPCVFYECGSRYDLIVNVDSFTEMNIATVRRYIDAAAKQSARLLSINHEHNAHRMADLFATHAAIKEATRSPYWMRRGYVEEVATFQSADDVA